MSDSYTPIHNDVLEALCKINLSPYETRVLLVIWRKTYGFLDKKTGERKKEDWISNSQIAQMTGLDRRLVYRALQGLKNKSVISRDDKKTAFSKSFIKDLSSVEMTENPSKDAQPHLSSILPLPVIDKDDKVSSILPHTKEKKETITKENMASPQKKQGMQPIGQIMGINIKTSPNVPSPGIYTEWQEKAFRYAKALNLTLGKGATGRWMKIFKQASEGRNSANLEKAYSFLIDYPKPMSNEQKMMFFFKIFERGTDWMKKDTKGGDF